METVGKHKSVGFMSLHVGLVGLAGKELGAAEQSFTFQRFPNYMNRPRLKEHYSSTAEIKKNNG